MASKDCYRSPRRGICAGCDRWASPLHSPTRALGLYCEACCPACSPGGKELNPLESAGPETERTKKRVPLALALANCDTKKTMKLSPQNAMRQHEK